MASEPTAESVKAAEAFYNAELRGDFAAEARQPLVRSLAVMLDAARANEREKCAKVAETPIFILSLPEQPQYEGDVGHVERRVCSGIAKAIRSLNTPKQEGK